MHLVDVWDQNRQELTLDQISDTLEHAAIDGEDKRFRETGGVDATSLVRSVASVIASGGKGGSGGSTITMQLVRNIKIQQASELPTAEEREPGTARRPGRARTGSWPRSSSRSDSRRRTRRTRSWRRT